ncbi:Fructose-1,6-bisphosphatase, active site protein [Pochonia chlamydosporia 170]|uniref:Fructose-1,6-bisphosphatase, active site protein n=1 Tax=Pochonia chlamydosporia 170 TaxID=1380566 RepID=A0A179FR63_METCM|nr:Fructose-1,6-bisphosphatase, active site protein [Pochonia chlamydosporia 170]OAQ67847.1 Fructose-1,6-bisphosphatase, active site protein [Pochonia chlamydosporia 170]
MSEPTAKPFHTWCQTSHTSHPILRQSLIPTLLTSISQIGTALRTSHHVSLAGTSNPFGDDQLNVDVTAETIIRAALAKCPSVITASSEEDPQECPVHKDSSTNQSEAYTVAFDPLDGSSIIAPNWSVGTIIGIWEGRTALSRLPSEKQVAAILGVYGPRTTAIVAIRTPDAEPVCFEVGLSDEGMQSYEMIRESVRLASPPFKTRYFAPANLRAAADDERYMNLVAHFIQSKYALRYSGGLVPDVVHALVKGHGVYLSPVTKQSKAKLRKLFELFPIALIVEAAGGRAIDPCSGNDTLSVGVEECDERGGLICGNVEDVEYVKRELGL